jgi:hypothetical protein
VVTGTSNRHPGIDVGAFIVDEQCQFIVDIKPEALNRQLVEDSFVI